MYEHIQSNFVKFNYNSKNSI